MGRQPEVAGDGGPGPAAAVAGPGRISRVQVVNAYVNAAAEVLAKETGRPVERLPLALRQNPYTTEDVTAVVGISGGLAGSFFLSMGRGTALGLVGAILGQPLAELDELVQSGVAELANVVAGRAGVALAEVGVTTTITPPLLLVGAGAQLSALEAQRLVVPLETGHGRIHVHLALRDG